ncbi:ABC transporter permease [Paenibacillus glycanilyticus]|uniref:Sugar ABC transporter permease n=1 Tax=Paenibacillus glycanilyticus TaxID=126569 RepID=A0ABQ6GJP3_9BACL|nr:ABC transporter permease subunit [Paenibacillus glycanilyticus]GLX71164.1 sugar ABC transporter permease [Paenibacillus glycanilyticus]
MMIRRLKDDLVKNKAIYIMLLPVVAYYIIFKYAPMSGAVIAFKDFSPGKGIWHSPWVGLDNFKDFFESYYFWRIIRNTLLISFYDLVFGFPAPIILALLINEVRLATFKRFVQTVSYLPHFISTVVICGFIVEFTSTGGIINSIISFFGGTRSALLGDAGNFRTIYVSSQIWQEIGWSSIIYLAALSGINPELYEAAKIDGAGRWKQTLNVTLPGITSIIVILLILKTGSLLDVGFEKIILLYSPMTYETADVISSFVYRMGIGANDYSFTTAVGLFQSIINFVLLFSANSLSRRLSGNKIW